jgi:aminoglycoside phosphotransferase family enzyme/predicted kinase
MPVSQIPLHPAWLDALTNPATYPHSVSHIQLTETHISWVALTGEWAYKLKKPVDFGFLDFTTLELRRAACHEEIRLNRRSAPEIYDDVIPLTAENTGPRFGGTGPVLEYAVRMRQFAQEDMLDQCLARGELAEDIIDTLASRVAELHHLAAVASSESPFGEPGTIHATVQACLEQLLKSAPDEVLRTQVDQLNEWTNAEWLRLKETFIARKRQGWVRECHGDLHLGNLVLYRGRPTLFDCLEFNPELRWIDVVSDVAFLVMDLFDRGAASLGWRVLNKWLQQTGDYAGLHVLRYYQSYRALVRAKVAALRLHQPEVSAPEVQHQQELLRSYAELALLLTRPVRPAILLMHGVSGSGKSFIAGRLSSLLGAVQIRSDIERKRLFGAWPPTENAPAPNPEMYAPQATQQTYARLQSLARDIVAAGYSVIVDATFLRHSERLCFASIADELEVPMIVVTCDAPKSVLRERVSQRQWSGQDPSDADVAVLEKQLESWEPLDVAEARKSVSIDTSESKPESILTAIRNLIQQAG